MNGTDATFYGPNGVRFTFTNRQPDGTYTSPAGSNMTLIRPDGSLPAHILTDNKSNDLFLFYSNGNLLATTSSDATGNAYQYASNTRVSKVTHKTGRSISFAYPTGSDLVSSATDSAGRVVSYEYDGNGRLTKVTATDGKVTTYAYDTTGRLSSMTVPASANATTTVSFQYDSSHRVTSVTREGAVVTSFAYTAGQTVVTNPNGKTATYSIDSSGRVTSTKDALNRTRSQTWTTNSDVATSTDAMATGNVSTYTYDQSGNRLSAQLPTGAAASAVYAIGSGCSAPDTGTAFQAKCSTDDSGNTHQYTYDGTKLASSTNTTGGGSTVEFQRSYGCDADWPDLVCSATDGNGNVTNYDYDDKGNLTTVDFPGTLPNTTYTHDSLGRVTSVTDGNGDTTSYQYDVRDRIVLTTFDDGDLVGSSYYPNGLERTRTDSTSGTVTYEYDVLGHLTKQAGPRSGVTQTFAHDKVGNLLTYTDAAGAVTYEYDDANQPTSVKEPGGTCPTTGNPAANSKCVKFEYDQNALEIRRLLPGGANVVTTRDNSGRPTRITAKDSAAAVAVDIGYTYTANGNDRVNVQSRTAFKEQGITAGAVTGYTYDTQNRLTLAEEKVGSTVSASWGYAYDNAGNRTSQTRVGSTGMTAGTITYGYNANNQLTSATGQTTTWTYDGAGNQTRNGLTGVTSTYGDRGEATQNGSTALSYAGTGNADRLAAGTTTFNNGALGLMQRTVGSAAATTYTRTPTGTAIGVRTSSTWNYYTQDHLGSTVGVFSSTGSYLGGYSYSPYGETRATGTNAAVTANPIRYIGEHHDGNGIYKLGARYYDTSLGRLTQMDPSGQEENPYGYVSCNPASMKDPSGTDAISFFCDEVLPIGTVVWTIRASLLAASGTIISWIPTPETVVAGRTIFVIGVLSGAIGLATSAALSWGCRRLT